MEQTFVGFAFGTSLTDTYIDAGQHARNQRNCMNVLLLSMPDYFEHMPPVAVRMPNGALTSLAGNVDSHHRVAVADLILSHRQVRNTVTGLVRDFDPDVVGLSVMTFQRPTAGRVIDLVRALKPGVKVVVGGYDPSLAREAYEGMNVDFIVRGEGEVTLRELLRAIEGYTLLGRQVDVIETSRGCTYDCSFCSIIEMRGRNFHTYRFERILADITDARDHGARTIFLVDDNITLNVHRFEALCHAIIEAGLNKLDYFVQAMTSAIATHGKTLAPLMRRAGFRYVFLGIENILEDDLQFLRATAKNTERDDGRNAGNASVKAIDWLHRNKMYVVGGLIVGNPDDTRESIEANLAFARRYVDWPYIQHPTPYPRTPMTEEFRQRGLITNERLEEYDGTTAVVRTEHVSAEEVEYVRWKAERWMKVRHIPAALLHDPWFVVRHAPEMLTQTFRGCTLRSVLGLEDERRAFERYKAIRHRERKYV